MTQPRHSTTSIDYWSVYYGAFQVMCMRAFAQTVKWMCA